MGIRVNFINNSGFRKVVMGDKVWCFGEMAAGIAGDTYSTTNGLAGGDVPEFITLQIRKNFGVGDVEHIHFAAPLSDASGPTTAEAQATFNYATKKIRLELVGKTAGAPGVNQQSGVEVANGASINNGTLRFFAICSKSGTSID